MFAGFNLKITDEIVMAVKPFAKIAEEQNFFHQQSVRKKLIEYVVGGRLDAAKIEQDWFPDVKADVFISHSHRDFDVALGLTGWFKSVFNVTCFIDSCVWGYADNLLKMIDDRYCVKGREEDKASRKTYSYNKRNQSTAHVHMILNTALQKMIDKTECLIFLDTPNSIITDEMFDEDSTASPWIYSELSFSKMVRKRKLSEYRDIMAHDGLFTAENQYVRYKVTTDHLMKLEDSDLNFLYNSRKKPPYQVMDDLYDHMKVWDYYLLEKE